MRWRTQRIEHIAREVRTTVDPANLAVEVVLHFSIPALDETGAPESQPPEEIQSAKQLLFGGEVLVSRLNPRKARVLRVPRLNGQAAVASGEFVVLLPTNIAPRYLEYVLLSETVRQHLDSAVQSVTRSHQRIRPEQLLKMKVRIPTSSTLQQAIADYLDAETSRIDALIAKKQQMIDLINERAQVVVARAFPTSLTYSTDGRPIGLAGVRCVRLGKLARVQTGLTLDGGKQGGADAVAFPYLRVANVQDGSLDLSELKEVTVSRVLATRSTLRAGDVLMTEGGDPDKLGRGAVWRGEVTPCLHQNHIFAVRPNPNLLPDFLALVTRTPYARAYFEMTASKTTGIASTSVSKIVSFHVPLPSIAEQAEVVRSTRSKLAQIDVLRKHVTEQIDLLVEHRQALITAGVTGELEVPRVAA